MLLDFGEAGTYRLITTSTIERDIAISNILRSSGAREAMITALSAGEEPDGRIFDAISGSGKLFDFLGAALMPEGDDPLKWTPEIARATAEKLKRIISPQIKQTLTLSVVELVKAFFLVGLHSLVTSLNSSAAKAAAEGVRPDGESAATTSSATGH